MSALAATDVTVISSVPLNQGPGKSLALLDIMLEPSAGIATSDTLDASALGVENIRSLLHTTLIDGNNWVHEDATNYAALTLEKRARVAHDAAVSGASLSSAARASDADLLTFTLAATRDAAWIQLIVEV